MFQWRQVHIVAYSAIPHPSESYEWKAFALTCFMFVFKVISVSFIILNLSIYSLYPYMVF